MLQICDPCTVLFRLISVKLSENNLLKKKAPLFTLGGKMGIRQQLVFLLQRKLIDEDIMQWMLEIQNYLVSQWNVDIKSNQVLILFNHLAMALGRIKRGYCVSPIAEDILMEMENAITYPLVIQRYLELQSLIPIKIPESEKTHILSGIYALSIVQPKILE